MRRVMMKLSQMWPLHTSMDTYQLWHIASSDPFIKPKFGGVFPSDGLPNRRGSYRAFIVNTDPSSLSGTHWVALYFKRNVCYYFDSYGNPPSIQSIIRFIKNNSLKLIYNKVKVQSVLTKTCGYHCLHFLYYMCRSLKVPKISDRDVVVFLKRLTSSCQSCQSRR
jgi:hypothetical protein